MADGTKGIICGVVQLVKHTVMAWTCEALSEERLGKKVFQVKQPVLVKGRPPVTWKGGME